MIRTGIAALVIIGGFAAGSAPAAGQAPAASTVRGLSLGVFSTNTALHMTDASRTYFGGGLGISVGYGFSDRFALHFATEGSWMEPGRDDDYILTHVDVEGRYTFGQRDSRWTPHAALGATVRSTRLRQPDAWTADRASLGVSAGGGIGYHISPAVALQGTLRYTFGNFNESGCPKEDGERRCATSARLNVGVVWHPRTR